MRDELELLRRLGPYLHGAGDDAAVVEVGEDTVVVTTDVLVHGVHFDRRLSSLSDVGWKAIAVNVSDLAAMAAQPLAATVGLCLPQTMGGEEVEELYEGMGQACRRWGLQLVGGDTVAADQLVLAVTALGRAEAPGPIWRSGAAAGDRIVVAGRLGAGAAALLQHHSGGPVDPGLLSAHRRPVALPDEGRALAVAGASAMIDVSDGLGADLGHVCAASGVRARVRAADLPVADGVPAAAARAGADLWELVCGGGEDYALLAALPAGSAVPTGAVVGEVLEPDAGAPTVELVLPDGSSRDVSGLGYDHLAGGQA